MKLVVNRGIGVASLLLTPFLSSGCAPELIKMEEADLARVRVEEIQAVHYSRATPTIFTGPLDSLAGMEILLLPFVLWEDYTLSKQVEALSLEDPVLRVKERFVFALNRVLDMKSVRPVPAPLVGDGFDELKAALGRGLVMDFKTINWVIGNSRSEKRGIFYHGVFHAVRSRIVRLEDSKVLWQGVCDPVPSSRFDSWDELLAENGTLLKVKLDKLAELCVQELLTQLVGKEFYEYLSEQAVSGEVRLPRGTAILSPELVKRAPSVTTAWTFYAASRMRYRNDHHMEIPEAKSGVKATFEEEVYARWAMVKFWQEVRKHDRDDYLEALIPVVAMDFMREYVHVFVVPASEEAAISTPMLKEFEYWRKENLPGHSATTLATIRAK